MWILTTLEFHILRRHCQDIICAGRDDLPKGTVTAPLNSKFTPLLPPPKVSFFGRVPLFRMDQTRCEAEQIFLFATSP